MYFVKRNRSEIVITGPKGFEKILPEEGIVIIKKQDRRDDWDESPKPATVRLKDMSDAEIVAYVLEL